MLAWGEMVAEGWIILTSLSAESLTMIALAIRDLMDGLDGTSSICPQY